jgi:hypothetical protein
MIDVDEIAATLATTPRVVRSIVAPFDDPALLARPAAGEWCVHEIVAHLITCDVGAFRDRIASLVSGSNRVAGFDAAAALAARDVTSRPLEPLLDEFESVRASSVDFVLGLRPDDLSASGEYSTHGTFTAGDFVLEWPYHDQDHIQQILANLQHRYLADMSDTMRSALLG